MTTASGNPASLPEKINTSPPYWPASGNPAPLCKEMNTSPAYKIWPLGSSPGEGNGLESSMDRGDWWATCSPWGCRVGHNEWLTLSLSLMYNAGEESFVQECFLIWVPWVWSPGGKITWRREWQLSSASLPEKSHGQRSLAGNNCPRGHQE